MTFHEFRLSVRTANLKAAAACLTKCDKMTEKRIRLDSLVLAALRPNLPDKLVRDVNDQTILRKVEVVTSPLVCDGNYRRGAGDGENPGGRGAIRNPINKSMKRKL